MDDKSIDKTISARNGHGIAKNDPTIMPKLKPLETKWAIALFVTILNVVAVTIWIVKKRGMRVFVGFDVKT